MRRSIRYRILMVLRENYGRVRGRKDCCTENYNNSEVEGRIQ